jgi:CBS domain-containing protein
MSPRAAWRLASLGYTSVFDYVAGKADWLAYALPWEGTADLIAPRVTRDVPTCQLDEPLDAVRARLERSRFEMAVVVKDAGIVLGRLDASRIRDRDADLTAGQVMTEGPTTVRPSEELDALTGRMSKANVSRIIVTFPDGRLHGLFEADATTHQATR